ncbi:DUF4145 domain-containing protein [Erysipelothrix inopinata]|uniref:DUF4145 domain-containing protein n=1 Tax=Erysipelothrix inopinata TaxID=225084 RepID=A0A7G9RYS7_9FIRM|nr:DUF4145 domain-containing protein [Erysipelothrix inopinata]QNN60752.1 DUF4145 domain-containing protein [Erysipelothrix inopinata]
MSTYRCGFCNTIFSKQFGNTYIAHAINKEESSLITTMFFGSPSPVPKIKLASEREKMPACLSVHYYICPTCNEISVEVHTEGSLFDRDVIRIRPRSAALQLPDFIPSTIKNDYEEACLIVDLSPKASATLSRRALQYMIRDFFDVKNKSSLHQEILAIKDKITDDEFNALMSLKSIGNIGAHPDKNDDINKILDIDPEEAYILIRLIEHFIDSWYIKRFEQEKLLDDIVNLSKIRSTTK